MLKDNENEEDSIYDSEVREESFKNDELDGREDAFMRGYEEDSSKEKNSDIGSELFGEDKEDNKEKEEESEEESS